MPKLDGEAAKRVDEAESSSSLIEDGIYEMVLTAVSATDKEGKPLATENAGPYWSWEYTFPTDAPRYKGRKVWDKTWLTEASAWKLQEVFTAFGVPSDTDTDELVSKGARVMVEINSYTLQKGPNVGEERNGVKKIYPLAGTAKTTGAKGKGTTAKPDLF